MKRVKYTYLDLIEMNEPNSYNPGNKGQRKHFADDQGNNPDKLVSIVGEVTGTHIINKSNPSQKIFTAFCVFHHKN